MAPEGDAAMPSHRRPGAVRRRSTVVGAEGESKRQERVMPATGMAVEDGYGASGVAAAVMLGEAVVEAVAPTVREAVAVAVPVGVEDWEPVAADEVDSVGYAEGVALRRKQKRGAASNKESSREEKIRKAEANKNCD